MKVEGAAQPTGVVNLFCCGLFHYRNYVEKLARDKILRRFVFSHKISTFHGFAWAKNIWLKEYLVRFCIRNMTEQTCEMVFPYIHDYWQLRASVGNLAAPIAHVMLPGVAPSFLKKLKAKGCIVLGEAVNTHPDNHFGVLHSEGLRCGLKISAELPKQWRRVRDCTELCDWILTPSPYVARTYIERGAPANRVKVIPFGGNIDEFRPPDDWTVRRNGPMEVLCVAQVIPRKGIHYLINAWQKLNLPSSQARLRIVGRVSHEMQHLRAKAVQGVEFVGTMSRSAIARELQAASVFVLPTLEEGFSYAILEAMAAGCAIITTPESGAEEVIKTGENGLLVNGRDVNALECALRLLYGQPKLRENMGRAALKSVREEYNWDVYRQRLVAFYHDILNDQVDRISRDS